MWNAKAVQIRNPIPHEQEDATTNYLPLFCSLWIQQTPVQLKQGSQDHSGIIGITAILMGATCLVYWKDANGQQSLTLLSDRLLKQFKIQTIPLNMQREPDGT